MRRRIQKWLSKPELVFATIATIFGVLSLFLMPILNAPDENQHFQVEYAMFSEKKKVPESLVLNEEIVLTTVRSGNYGQFFSIDSAVQKDGVAINTGSLVFDGKTKASAFDIMRLPQALGVLIGRLIHPSIGVMVITGRLFALLVYIAAMYLIIKRVRHSKWAVLTIASLPIMIHQAASLSYDSINLLAIFAWVAFIINLSTQTIPLNRKQVFIGLALALFLFVTKSNNLLLTVLLFVLPPKLITETVLYKKVHNNKYHRLIWVAFSAIAMAIICLAIYVVAKKFLAGQEFHPHRLLDVLLNTFFWGDLALIDVTAIGMIGFFGNFYYHLPVWVVTIAFILIAIVMLAEKLPNISKRLALTSGLLFIGSILLISIGMYYGWAMKPERLGAAAQVTDGIQGRYFAPLLILLLPLFAYLQKYIKITAKHKLTIPATVVVSITLFLTLYLVQTVHFFWT